MYKSNKRVLNELPACYAILRKLSVCQNLLMSEKAVIILLKQKNPIKTCTCGIFFVPLRSKQQTPIKVYAKTSLIFGNAFGYRCI